MMGLRVVLNREQAHLGAPSAVGENSARSEASLVVPLQH